MVCIYVAVTNMLAYVFTSCWQIQDFRVSDNDMTDYPVLIWLYVVTKINQVLIYSCHVEKTTYMYWYKGNKIFPVFADVELEISYESLIVHGSLGITKFLVFVWCYYLSWGFMNQGSVKTGCLWVQGKNKLKQNPQYIYITRMNFGSGYSLIIKILHVKTRCVCETQMHPIMVNSNDGQVHKDPNLDTSTKRLVPTEVLSHRILMWNIKALFKSYEQG